MTAPELLPCPFCGRDASHNNGGGSIFGRFWWTVGCKTCDIMVSDPEVWDKKNPGMLDPAYPAKWCIAAWNRRTTSPEVAALIAEARREERERMLCVLGEEYILKHASEGPDERLGRASAVRGVAVRMGLYADLDRAIDAAIRALKEETP